MPEKTEKTGRASEVSTNIPTQVYLKALPLRNLQDVQVVKRELESGNILILRVTPLAKKSVDDVKKAVNDLYQFTKEIGGEIARLGEERVVIVPSFIKIWREKAVVPKEKAPTAT
jgi:SepF-like predicted cell division protein (DUF552 family)